MVERFRTFRWIDAQTRLVALLVNVYNPNLNLLASLRYFIEITPGGAFFKFQRTRIIYPDMYESVDHFFIGLVDASLFLITCFFLFKEYKLYKSFQEDPEVNRTKWGPLKKYASDAWNVYEVIIAALFLSMLGIRLAVVANPTRTKELPWSSYKELGSLGFLQDISFSMEAFVMWLLIFKQFQFVALSQRLNLMWLTISEARKHLLIFALMFLMLLVGFVLLVHEVFGSEVDAFAQVLTANRTLLTMLVGPLFDYETLRRVNRVWAPVFYISFVIVMQFTMASIFLAIINHSYTVLKRRFYGLARSQRASGKDPMAVGMLELCAALFPFVEEIKRKWKARQEHARRERRLARRQAEIEMKELEAMSK